MVSLIFVITIKACINVDSSLRIGLENLQNVRETAISYVFKTASYFSNLGSHQIMVF